MERRGSVESVLASLSETWSEETARRVLADLAANKGKKKTAEYAREHGFHPSRINWWRKELARRDGKSPGLKPKAAAFVAIEPHRDGAQIVAVPTVMSAGATDAIELVIDGRGNRSVRLRSGFDVETLRRLLRVLEGAPC